MQLSVKTAEDGRVISNSKFESVVAVYPNQF